MQIFANMQNSKLLFTTFMRRFNCQRIIFNRTFLVLTNYGSASIQRKLITNQLNGRNHIRPVRLYHDETFTDGEDDINNIYQEPPKTVKHLLYATHQDALLPFLNGCASIKEVFEFLRKYEKIIQPMHLAQAVLVLWDLQQIFQHVTEMTNMDKVEKLMQEYSNQLLNRHEFQVFLDLLEKHSDIYNANELGCIYIYLSKIGVSKSNLIMKLIFTKLCNLIPQETDLFALSHFMISCNISRDPAAYELCKQLLSVVLEKLGTCQTGEDLKQISICLNVLNKEITAETIKLYETKLNSLLSEGLITSKDVDVLMKVILFLHYPQWRHKHSELLSTCILMLKDKINQLSLNEILVLNEVFLKTQEPATILFELQRCTAKLLRDLEENEFTNYDKRIQLVNSLIQLSAPVQRPNSEAVIRKYLSYPLNGKSLLTLLKALQYTKIMDPLLCKSFWDKVLIELEHSNDFKNNSLFQVCYLYLIYNQNLPYRHAKLEKRMNQWIEGIIETTCLLENPKKFTALAAFVIPYGNDVSIMNFLANIFRDNWRHFNVSHCVTLCRSLNFGKNITKNIYLKPRYYDLYSDTVNHIVNVHLNQESNKQDEGLLTQEIDVIITNAMMKTFIYQNQLDHPTVNQLLLSYKPDTYLSSKQIKNLTMCLLLSSALLPSILERMVEYVCKCKENILAFNAEKVAFLCYYLGYIPKNSEQFSKVLTDLILRDQEKINGLSYLQSCLSLCFFNRMTGPLIKQIFNVRFMEKLDFELKHCYAKDIYPSRVHRRLMELNRTVCIDYPELNIPWFHQKYIQESQLTDSQFHNNVEIYFHKIFYDCDVETNKITPYGYNIDFTIKYNDDNNRTIKLAVLLMKPREYTNINRQLKGAMQTKIRHIEMLGYKVKTLAFDEWNSLIYGEDKIAYLRNLLDLPGRYPQFYRQLNS